MSLFQLRLFLAQEGGATAGGEGNAQAPGGFGFFLPMILIIVIFYVLIIRPESKKKKAREQMVAAVKKGDTVVTTGGIKGYVKRVDDGEVVVQIDKDKDVKVRFLKAAILEVVPKSDGNSSPSEDTEREIQQRAG